MSWSLEEPEWPPVCECQYDEFHDRMDRGNGGSPLRDGGRRPELGAAVAAAETGGVG